MKDFFDKIKNELKDKDSNYVIAIDFSKNTSLCKNVKDAFIKMREGNCNGWKNTGIDISKIGYLGFSLRSGMLFMYYNTDCHNAKEYLDKEKVNAVYHYHKYILPVIKQPKRKLEL